MNDQMLKNIQEFAKLLHKKPDVWQNKQLDFLKRAISYANSEENCKNNESESEEEAPSEPIKEYSFESYRSCSDQATVKISND